MHLNFEALNFEFEKFKFKNLLGLYITRFFKFFILIKITKKAI